MQNPKFLTAVAALCLMLAATGANAAKCALSQTEVAFATKVLQLTNTERRRKGLRALKRDSRVQAAAQAHACDMMRKRYFSHRSKNGADFGRRLLRHGCEYRFGGENIARTQRTPAEVMRAWMKSPGHRKNILIRHGVDRFGVGIAKSDRGYYWVIMFARDC